MLALKIGVLWSPAKQWQQALGARRNDSLSPGALKTPCPRHTYLRVLASGTMGEYISVDVRPKVLVMGDSSACSVWCWRLNPSGSWIGVGIG